MARIGQDVPHPKFTPVVLAALLAGCAGVDVPMGTSGMERTVTKRDESGMTTVARSPYPEVPQRGQTESEREPGQWLKDEMGRGPIELAPRPALDSVPPADSPVVLLEGTTKTPFDFKPSDIDLLRFSDELAGAGTIPELLRREMGNGVATALTPETVAAMINQLLGKRDLHLLAADVRPKLSLRGAELLEKVLGAEKEGRSVSDSMLMALNRALVQAAFPGGTANSSSISISLDQERQQDASFSEAFSGTGPILGGMNLRLWTKLTTRFASPSFTSLSWAASPRLSAPGWEVGYTWRDEDSSAAFVTRFAHFEDDLVLNSQSENGFFVREEVILKGGYLEGGVEYFALDWLRGDLLLGVFNYHVRTTVQTNAPTYTYEGLMGNRTMAIFGIGGALETPWRYPLKLYAGGRLYVPFNPFDPEEELLETVFGQGNVGVKWVF